MASDGGISISIGPEHFVFVDSCIASGRYESADDVVRAGLDVLRDQQSQLERARSMIATGARDLDEGRVVDGEAFFRRMQEKHEAYPAIESDDQ